MRTRKKQSHILLGVVVFIVFIFFLIVRWSRIKKISLTTTIVLRDGDSLMSLYEPLSRRERLRLKRYLRSHDDLVTTIQPWSYVFTGKYTPAEILNVFREWPKLVYEHITLLEWWNSYDVDRVLSASWRTQPWAYRAFITDDEIISRYVERYEFLRQAVAERGELISLEGYLYPDTYYIEPSKDIIDQLVYLQLEAFEAKIREPFGEQLASMSDRLADMGMSFRLTSYGALILGSIIEKEERTDANKADVAAVFFNRLENGMRLDADISLCYGLGEWYEACTPESIVANLRDASNQYNTRMLSWLPPTPICTPSSATIQALVSARSSDNFYYLHDRTWVLHLSETISEHNSKKSKYLN